MFLHLGADVSVFVKDVVMIMDAQRANESPKSREYIEQTRNNGNYYHLCEGEPKSYVLVQRGLGAPVLYTSAISAATLYKRCQRPTLQF
jgi:hypothetical protein